MHDSSLLSLQLGDHCGNCHEYKLKFKNEIALAYSLPLSVPLGDTCDHTWHDSFTQTLQSTEGWESGTMGMQSQPRLTSLFSQELKSTWRFGLQSANRQLNALNYTWFLALPLQSLCRGPGHLVLSLQTALKFRLPNADSRKPPFLSIITASRHLLIFSLFCLLHMLHSLSVLAQFNPGASCWSLATLPCPYSKHGVLGFNTLNHMVRNSKSPFRRSIKENLAVQDVGGRRHRWSK